MTSRFQRGKECDKQKRELQWKYIFHLASKLLSKRFLPPVSSTHMLLMDPMHTAVHYQRVFHQW
jgi:hypothetical protein